MHELLRWHDGTLYINGWLFFGLIVAITLGWAIGKTLGDWIE